MDQGNGLPPIMEGYIFGPLTQIWEERKIKPPADDESHWKSLLDDIHGEKDACKWSI